jgi:hypothetical protein
MNTAYWHLILNHFPVIGTIIGTLILISGFILKKNATIQQTALGVFVFSALCAIPVYLTGEGAEEVVEKMPGVTESLIENHEDLGKNFMIVISALGLLSLITFITDLFKNKIASVLYIAVLISAIGTSIMAKQVGTSGGEVRHTEIRGDIIQQQGNTPEPNNGGEKDDD